MSVMILSLKVAAWQVSILQLQRDRGYSLVEVHGPLIVEAFLVAEHEL